MQKFVDNPAKDFRGQYQLPYHFTRHAYHSDRLPAIEYEGYVTVTLGLLPPAPCQILDVGCGDGYIARMAIDRGYQVVGVDYADRAISYAQLLAPEGEYLVADVRELASHHQLVNRFQAAYCVEVMEHLPPDYHYQLLTNIHKCLDDSGCLILSVPSIHAPLGGFHYKHFDHDEVTALLAEVGFQVDSITNQWVLCSLTSPRFWRFFQNNYYDLVMIRRQLKKHLLKKYNTTDDPRKAGRYIFKATKVS